MVSHSFELKRASGASSSPHRTPHKSPIKRHQRDKCSGRVDDDQCFSEIMTPLDFILRHTGFKNISSAYDFSNCQVCAKLESVVWRGVV